MPGKRLDDLYAGKLDAVFFSRDRDQECQSSIPGDLVVLAGSFNPLHRGHVALLEAAERVTGRTGAFEISIENVDKPRMPRDELERRLGPALEARDVVVTGARLFADKARQLNGAWFAIGFDTAVRLLDDRYYPADGAPGPAERAVMRLADSGTKFVVGGRVDESGFFCTVENLDVPESLSGAFIWLDEQMFRVDTSSTGLRRPDGGG